MKRILKRIFSALALSVALTLPAFAAVHDHGYTATEVASGTADAQAVAASSGLRLMGFGCKEDAAGTAEFIIRNGTEDTDPVLAFVTLTAGESVREYFGGEGLKADDGIFIERVSGTTHIVILSRGN